MKNSLLKIFYIFIFTCISLHIFMLDLSIFEINYSGINKFYLFYLELWMSMEKMDISFIILGIFIYNFYYHIYFIDGNWRYTRLIAIFFSIFVSVIIILSTSYNFYGDFRIVYFSIIQFYKSFIVGIGYYLFIYGLIKKILFIEKRTGDEKNEKN